MSESPPDKILRAYSSPYRSYRLKTKLYLPFKGEWFVVWGGRKLRDNAHAITPDQRYAYDFVQLRQNHSHSEHPRTNAAYHCWNAPLYAPAHGRVVGLCDTIPDNEPGQCNRSDPLGNHLVLQLQDDEYAFCAHLRHKSLKVKLGAELEQGALFGHCGNSGNSTEPHLHFHVQSTAHFRKAYGLPAPFHQLKMNGRNYTSLIPRRGSFISPQ